MRLRSSVRGAIRQDVGSVSLGRDSDRDPDRHPANSIILFASVLSNIHLDNNFGDGSNSRMFKCGSKRCLFQNKFSPQDRFVSTTTGRIYNCIIPPGTTYINDHSSNVIYLITCDRCKLQYVGETCQNLNNRFNWHNSCFRNPAKFSFCKVLNNHFHKGPCKDSTYNVTIIEKLEGTGRTNRNLMDKSVTPFRKSREVFWMHELRTVFPYGLNDRVGDEYKTNNTHINVANRFSALPRKHIRVNRGVRKGTPRMLPNVFIQDLMQKLTTNISDVPNFIRVCLSNMKKANLRIVHQQINDKLSSTPSDFPFKQYFLQVLDTIESKLYKPNPPKKKRKSPDNICSILFDNKGVEFINLSRILHDPDITSSLPSTPIKFPIPMVTYQLCSPLSTKIFNFNTFVNNLNLDEFIRDPHILPCNCENSFFKDDHHNHIVTGDLRIIANNHLRKFFSKGPKFRENKNINLDKAKSAIINGLEQCINNWCEKHGVSNSFFSEWIVKVKEKVNSRVTNLEETLNIKKHSDSFFSSHVKSELEKIHENYVVVPIDKASGNIALVCKRFYASVIVNELGLDKNNLSDTYKVVSNSSEDVIIENNIKDLKSKFGIKNIDNENHCLPNMYWMPKLHKTPIKARFIIASPKSSIKPLAKAITSAFRLFYKQIESYNDKCRFFTGVNTFWVVQSNKPVTVAINKLNTRNRAKSISTFDFSTLYTKLPHKKLESVLHHLIDFCFNGGTKKFLLIDNYGARWVSDVRKNKICWSRQQIKDAVSYLLTNCNFTVGSKILCQIIGIPMGSDPAPFFANLFLYYFESEWMNDLKKNDLILARKLSNIFRFIDDLSVVNDDGIFEVNIKDIYPKELELTKENYNSSEASFLDLNISIKDNKFQLGLFDKRDSFPFNIVRMPFKSSNIPSNMFYSSIGAECLRIARACNNPESFSRAIKPLVERMIKQGGDIQRIKNCLKKFFNRHQNDFIYVGKESNDLTNLLF